MSVDKCTLMDCLWSCVPNVSQNKIESQRTKLTQENNILQCSCWGSNPQSSDHESGTHPLIPNPIWIISNIYFLTFLSPFCFPFYACLSCKELLNNALQKFTFIFSLDCISSTQRHYSCIMCSILSCLFLLLRMQSTMTWEFWSDFICNSV